MNPSSAAAQPALDPVSSSSASGETREPEQIAAPAWSPAARVGFRFAFCYLLLYNFPFPLEMIPGPSYLAEWYGNGWAAFVPWAGKLLFGLDITVLPNGSGDTTFNYVQVFLYAVLALAATVIWSLVDRRRTRYPRLYEGIRIYVRYTLGATLISYGMYKVIKTQFPFPFLWRLLEPYGESSPMGLLWTFMGYSLPYNIFTGAAEVVGGFLLFFRRTTTLGALVGGAVMLNVAVLNFTYDVPVKLYSSHLLLMAVLLTLPDLRRLANVLVFNRIALPAHIAPPILPQRWHYTRLAVKALFVVAAIWMPAKQSYDNLQLRGEYAKRPPLYGIYDVGEFVRNGQSVPPLTTDPVRWRKLVCQFPTRITVKLMDDSLHHYGAAYDAAKKTLTLTVEGDPAKKKYVLQYAQTAPDQIQLSGRLLNDDVVIKASRFDESKFLLVNRTFHWINERPLNK